MLLPDIEYPGDKDHRVLMFSDRRPGNLHPVADLDSNIVIGKKGNSPAVFSIRYLRPQLTPRFTSHRNMVTCSKGSQNHSTARELRSD
jgi:hypothetical protein